MKILIYKRNCLINTSGGAEKAMCGLASHFAAFGHDVLMLTRDTRDGMPFYFLDKRIKLVKHNRSFGKFRHLCGKLLRGAKWIYFDRDAFIAKENRIIIDRFNPDVIIATSPACAKEILRGQTGLPPVIVTLHSCPDYFFKNKRKSEEYIETLKRAAVVLVLQPSFVKDLKLYYDGETEVIGNSIAFNNNPADYSAKRIVCLARVEPDKGQYELIAAFCQIARAFPCWTVDLYGDVTHLDYKNKCVKLARRYGVAEQILFHGVTCNVSGVLATASICAFPSKFEGFGMGLGEALAAGLPSVGFKSAKGVNEMIRDGENGFLVENTDDFANKLERLMTDEKLRQAMGQNAKISMRRFAPENVWKKWDELIKKKTEKK